MGEKKIYIKKFQSQLGNTSDFVNYVKDLEVLNKLKELGDFKGTDNTKTGKRYLLIKNGGVIDFRHFFAAMAQRLQGIGHPLIPVSTSEGKTLLLGVLNEINQCIDESTEKKLHSCFSKEDLISNRLGARFGELVVISRAEARSLTVANYLNSFLSRLSPIIPSEVNKLKMQNDSEIIAEAFGAIFMAIGDFLVGDAY